MFNKFIQEAENYLARVLFIGMGLAALLIGLCVRVDNPIAFFWMVIMSVIFIIAGIFNQIKYEEDI